MRLKFLDQIFPSYRVLGRPAQSSRMRKPPKPAADAPRTLDPSDLQGRKRASSPGCIFSSRTFSGRALLPSDEPGLERSISLTAEGHAFRSDVANILDVNVGIVVTGGNPDDAVDLSVEFFGPDGKPDGRASMTASFKPTEWPIFSVCRFFPPRDAAEARFRLAARQHADAPPILCHQIKTAVHFKGISVVVGAYKAEDHLPPLLKSFADQSLSPDLFELIFVINGPRDGSSEIIETWRAAHPEFKVTILQDDLASLGNARNRGIEIARYSHVTFVDCDDTISRDYLSGLFRQLSVDGISVANIVDIGIDGSSSGDSPVNREVTRAQLGKIDISFDTIRAMSTLSVCKAIPTFFCRVTPFLAHLKSGEDVVFYCTLYSLFNPSFKFTEADDESIYFRLVRGGSMSRRDNEFSFAVGERLDVISSLNDLLRSKISSPLRAFTISKIRAQANVISRFLYDHPDAFANYVELASSYNFVYFPWRTIAKNGAARIVFSYCFPPTVDPSAVTAAKRMVEYGAPCDVVSNRLRKKHTADPRLLGLISDHLGHHARLSLPPSFNNGPGVAAFAEDAAAMAEEFAASRGRPYTSIYSRVLWPASHFAAALHKMRHPECEWEAEFSDPVLRDSGGMDRQGRLPPGWLEKVGLSDALRQRGVAIDPQEERLFYWSEIVPYVLADRLIFINATQLELMLSYCPGSVAPLLQSKAVVRPHPILRRWRLRPDKPYRSAMRDVNIGYFGSFYPTRQLNRVFHALRAMDASERNTIRLFIFTRGIEDVFPVVRYAGLEDTVIVRPELPYVEFLDAMNDFDALLVNDVEYLAGRNPYLPSKLSDYAASNVPILALYQADSELSRRPEPRYRCELSGSDFERSFIESLRQIAREGRAAS